MLVKARSRHRFQRTGGVYLYRCRNRLPIPENRFDIPNRLRYGVKPTSQDRAISVLRVPEAAQRWVSTRFLRFLGRVEVPESQGVGIALSVVVKVSVFSFWMPLRQFWEYYRLRASECQYFLLIYRKFLLLYS